MKKPFILLLAILLIGFGLRLFNAGSKSLWGDEVATIASALGNSIDPTAWQLRGKSFDPDEPIPAKLYLAKATTSHGAFNLNATNEALTQNVHPPFFFWLMNGVIHTFGSDALSLRLPAILFGVLSIGLMFLVGQQLAGTSVGLLTASIMALSGYQLAHSQDARAYTLLICIALASVWILNQLCCAPTKPRFQRKALLLWLGFTGLSVMGLYTQYLYGFFWALLLLWFGWQGRKNRTLWLGLVVSAGVTVLCLAPWTPYFNLQQTFVHHAGHYTDGLWKPFQLPEKLWRIVCDFIWPSDALARIYLLVLNVAAVGVLIWRKQSFKDHLQRGCFKPLFWLLGLLLLLILLDIVKASHVVTIRRYSLLAAPAVYVLLSLTLLKTPWPLLYGKPWLKWGFTTITLLWVSWNSLQVVQGKAFHSENIKGAAEFINAGTKQVNNPSRQLVLVNQSGAIAVGVAYYLTGETPMLGLAREMKEQPHWEATLAKRLTQAAQTKQTVYLVLSHASEVIEAEVTKTFQTLHWQAPIEHKFNGVRVLVFRQQVA